MCKAVEDMREKAVKENRKEIAWSLLADGDLSLEKIVKHTGLSLEEVLRLKNA